MQNEAALGFFIDVRNMHNCYMKFDYVRTFLHVRNIGMKSVLSKNQFCMESISQQQS